MTKNKILFATILLLSFIAVFFVLNTKKKTSQVCFSKNCFIVEVADTPNEQIRGLMFRDELAENKGMFFVFDREDTYSFWMKNTFIPLDIIWINQKKEIVFIKKDVQLCDEDFCPTITPNQKALYVLELNAGIVDKIGIAVGDKVIVSI